MQITSEKTVREIALEDPSSIRVFESLGIDYCCGGKRPLGDACFRAEVAVDDVVKLLEQARSKAQAPESQEWKKLGELIESIVGNHHAYVRRETPRIDGFLTKVVARHGAAHPEVTRISELFSAISSELATHMLKEEQILFPYIERMEKSIEAGNGVPSAFFGTVRRPIASMIADHDDAGALLAEIRKLSQDFHTPDGACPTYVGLYQALEEFERDLHRHVHLENNILFPRAVEMEAA